MKAVIYKLDDYRHHKVRTPVRAESNVILAQPIFMVRYATLQSLRCVEIAKLHQSKWETGKNEADLKAAHYYLEQCLDYENLALIHFKRIKSAFISNKILEKTMKDRVVVS